MLLQSALHSALVNPWASVSCGHRPAHDRALVGPRARASSAPKSGKRCEGMTSIWWHSWPQLSRPDLACLWCQGQPRQSQNAIIAADPLPKGGGEAVAPAAKSAKTHVPRRACVAYELGGEATHLPGAQNSSSKCPRTRRSDGERDSALPITRTGREVERAPAVVQKFSVATLADTIAHFSALVSCRTSSTTSWRRTVFMSAGRGRVTSFVVLA